MESPVCLGGVGNCLGECKGNTKCVDGWVWVWMGGYGCVDGWMDVCKYETES